MLHPKFPFPKLYAETRRHPDNLKLCNELGEYIRVRVNCNGKHSRNRNCQFCRGR